MKYFGIFIYLISYCLIGLFSQNMKLCNDIPVIVNGDSIKSAWSGAMNAPQFGQTDLNSDGILDLVLFDRLDRTFTPYLNISTQIGQRNYRFSPKYKGLFDTCHCAGWASFVDYDCDGDNDIFCGTPSSNVIIYEHIDINSNSFIYQTAYPSGINSQYQQYYGNLFSGLLDYPAIYDVDQDGDIDFLTFGNYANYIDWHKNMAKEKFNRCDTLVFQVESSCWGHFYENPSNCTPILHDTISTFYDCPLNGFHPNFKQDSLPEHPRHSGGATILALDLNGNKNTDLLIGDVECPNIYALINNAGALTHAYIDSAQMLYPQSNVPINVYKFPATFYWDIDADGIKDLIYAPNEKDEAENYNAVGLYKNLGQDNNPNFDYQGRGFIQNETLEFGTGAAPTYFDYNQDGKLDLLVGNFGYFSNTDTAFHSQMALLENTGNDSLVAFTLVTDNYLPYIPLNNNILKRVVPTLGDLDADGDKDLVLGSSLGNIYYFRNDAIIGGNANFQFVSNALADITGDTITNSAPALYDIDNDNDLDLFIGTERGYIAYFQNTGTPQSANFELITLRWGNIKVNNLNLNSSISNGEAKPIFYDYNQDGNMDLLVGTIYGNVRIYTDISSTLTDTLNYLGHLFDFDFGSFSAPTAAVIDTSEQPVFIVGNQRGGLQLYKVPYYEAPDISNLTFPNTLSDFDWLISPNPADNILTIQFNQMPTNANIYIYNMLGQEMAHLTTNETKSTFSLSGISTGIYSVLIENGNKRGFKKLIIR